MEIELRRRFFAEELEAVCKLRTPALVDAFARVPRDQFLPPGPWTVLSESGESYMMGGGSRTRLTPDADPARVHHNIAVAIDADRQLFNGQPATLGTWIDALAPGGRHMLPLTATMLATESTLGKGLVFLLTRDEAGGFAARVIAVVAVYSALGIRDPTLNDDIGKALMAGPARWTAVRRLRHDLHEPDASCWLHRPAHCLSTRA
jgi:protein-L-isoaspartate(D-aspartate) O-methyltransferase